MYRVFDALGKHYSKVCLILKARATKMLLRGISVAVFSTLVFSAPTFAAALCEGRVAPVNGVFTSNANGIELVVAVAYVYDDFLESLDGGGIALTDEAVRVAKVMMGRHLYGQEQTVFDLRGVFLIDSCRVLNGGIVVRVGMHNKLK